MYRSRSAFHIWRKKLQNFPLAPSVAFRPLYHLLLPPPPGHTASMSTFNWRVSPDRCVSGTLHFKRDILDQMRGEAYN